jgi:hypothetical protein
MGLIGWLVALGCLFIGAAIGVWSLSEFNKLVAIWALFVPGAILLVVAGGAELHVFFSDAKAIISKPESADPPKENPLRAYVFTDMNEVVHEPGRPAKVILHIKNSGQTPAYDLTWRARFSVASIELEDQIAVDQGSYAAKQISAQGGFLAYVYTFPEDGWEPRFDGLIREEKAAIYGVGQIRYKDIDGKERYTDYLLKSGGRFGTKSGIAPGKFGVISAKSN